jgi:hypothetical protein
LLESDLLLGAAQLELGAQIFTEFLKIALVRLRNRKLAGIELLVRRGPSYQRPTIISDVENKLLSGFVSQKSPEVGQKPVVSGYMHATAPKCA